MRVLGLILLIFALIIPISACGKKDDPIPPPGKLQVAPEHAEFLVAHRSLLDGTHNGLRRLLVLAKTLESQGEVTFRLAAQLEPVLGGLSKVIVDRLLCLRVDLLVLEEEAAPVEVEGDGGGQVVLVLVTVVDNPAVTLLDPAIHSV